MQDHLTLAHQTYCLPRPPPPKCLHMGYWLGSMIDFEHLPESM